MASSSSSHHHLRTPTLLLITLSLILNLAIITTASHTLSIFHSQRSQNVYYLPIWSSHFDMRGLGALIGTSVVVLLCNAIFAAAVLFISSSASAASASSAAFPPPKNNNNNARLIILASSATSTIVSLIGLAFPAALSSSSSSSSGNSRTTLQTWTCNWSRIPNQGVPASFQSLCYETRFAFYTTIPILILQLLLLGTAVFAFSNRNANANRRRSSMRLDDEVEKNHGDYEMRSQVQKKGGSSFDTKEVGSAM